MKDIDALPRPEALTLTARATWTQLMQGGLLACRQARYPEAVDSYSKALQAEANHPRSIVALEQAKYLHHLANGRNLLAAKRYPEALVEFERALQENQTDPIAEDLWKQTRQLAQPGDVPAPVPAPGDPPKTDPKADPKTDPKRETTSSPPLPEKTYLVPGSLAGRTGASRDKLLQQYGGNLPSEAAVSAGLKWIVRHQALDGHWGMHDFHVHGRCNCGGQGGNHDVAGTALAILALLGNGETHKATGRQYIYTKNVDRGLRWLITRQAADGSFSGNGYEQGIASLAICEAFAMTRDPALRGRLSEPSMPALPGSMPLADSATPREPPATFRSAAGLPRHSTPPAWGA
jgi:tetratricopeptide (TPR) repeat protein